jgi:hypothetical protein
VRDLLPERVRVRDDLVGLVLAVPRLECVIRLFEVNSGHRRSYSALTTPMIDGNAVASPSACAAWLRRSIRALRADRRIVEAAAERRVGDDVRRRLLRLGIVHRAGRSEGRIAGLAEHRALAVSGHVAAIAASHHAGVLQPATSRSTTSRSNTTLRSG